MKLGPHTITVWRDGPPTEDEHHNPIPGEPVSHPIEGCSFQPGAGSEYVIDRSSTTTTATVWVPPDGDIRNDDEVEFAGNRYQIDGPVQPWLFGTPLDHLVVSLTFTKG